LNHLPRRIEAKLVTADDDELTLTIWEQGKPAVTSLERHQVSADMNEERRFLHFWAILLEVVSPVGH
jgi:hypothetical protein